MVDSAEKSLSRFYNSVGWESKGGATEDARLWEDLRNCAEEYAAKSRLRVMRHIPPNGTRMLDMASGPIQYSEYLTYSKHFTQRYCVDLSLLALQTARERIGDHGVFWLGNFLDLPVPTDFFDCAISLHTIYHIRQERQEEAVRKLIRSVKPGAPVIIVYSNPRSAASLVRLPIRILKQCRHLFGRAGTVGQPSEDSNLYFYTHPIAWWQKFQDVATVQILPWRSLTSETQRLLIPDNAVGRTMLAWLFALEEWFPNVFARCARYPMIILNKNT